MQNKKQAFNQIERTISWNTTRGNTPDTLDWNLEIAMLQEELNELAQATTNVDRFDALLDLKFVLLGSLGKMALYAHQIVDGYEAVISANETKSATKNAAGKITKCLGFKGPEDALNGILDLRYA